MKLVLFGVYGLVTFGWYIVGNAEAGKVIQQTVI